MKQEIKDLIINKIKEGQTQSSIAKELGININTIGYNLNPKSNACYKKNSQKRYERVKNSKKYKNTRREYMKKYMVERYHADPLFRQRIIQTNTTYRKRMKGGQNGRKRVRKEERNQE